MAVLAVHPQRQGLHLRLVPPDRTQRIIYPRMSAKEMTIEKTRQHSANETPKTKQARISSISNVARRISSCCPALATSVSRDLPFLQATHVYACELPLFSGWG